jgi:hypothetical protein
MKRWREAAVGLACLLSCVTAQATAVTWRFTGEITSPWRGPYFFPFTVAVGDPFTLDLQFDSATPCSSCSSNTNTYDNALTSATFAINGSDFGVPLGYSNQLWVRNDVPGGNPCCSFFIDDFAAQTAGFGAQLPGIFFQMNLDLSSGNLLSPQGPLMDAQLSSLSIPDPSAFDGNRFFDMAAATADGGFNDFGGRLLSSEVLAVPEPEVISLLLVSLLGCASGALSFTRHYARSRSNGLFPATF